jgi:murein peptide amidase A
MIKEAFFNREWIKTSLGTPVELWASAPLEALKGQNPILLMGGVHGDEPEGVRLAREALEWLKNHTFVVPQSKPVAPWVVIPCLNVDGFAKGTRVNGRGVDLNRNYPSSDWTQEAKAERYFPGAGPGSEIEIQGVVRLMEDLKPRLIIHCHSWKPCIVATGPISKRDALRLGASSGYEVMDEIGYPTPGSLSGYGWRDKQIPIICIEENDQLKDHNTIWPRFKKGFEEIFFDLDLRRG